MGDVSEILNVVDGFIRKYVVDYIVIFIVLCVLLAVIWVMLKVIMSLSGFCYRLMIILKNQGLDMHRSLKFRRQAKALASLNPARRVVESALSDLEVVENFNGFRILIKKSTGEILSSYPIVHDMVNLATTKVPEMAVKNNSYYPITLEPEETGTTPDGLISIRDASGKPMAMGCRVDFNGKNCLLTAAHVWKDYQESGKNWRAEHKGITLPIEDHDWTIEFISDEDNRDVVILSTFPSFFSRLKVKKLKVKSFVDKISVLLNGYLPHGLHYTMAQGDLGEEWGTVQYRASTEFGWSGTPILQGGFVVGIHTHRNEVTGVNCGTSSAVWLGPGVLLESDVNDSRKHKWVAELPSGQARYFTYCTPQYVHRIKYIGQFASIVESKPHKGINHVTWTPQDDVDLYEDEMDSRFESGFQRGVQRSPTPSLGSLNSGDTLGSMEKQLKKVLGSIKSEPARTGVSVRKKGAVTNSTKMLQSGVSRSLRGISLPEMPTQSDEACTSRPRDTTVLLVTMTRWEERLYNRICHTRAFQRALRESTRSGPNMNLRMRTLEYVMSSAAKLSENPLQDFLATL